jgi:hypothetical protein
MVYAPDGCDIQPVIVDEVTGARRADEGASVGTYLALAALNRVVAPCSKLGFAD